APSPIAVQCAPMTTGTVGTPYSSTVVATGGTGGYTFALIGGALPSGLTLNPTSGVISGTPGPTAYGTFSYKVQVTDSQGNTATTGATSCTLVIAPLPITVQ